MTATTTVPAIQFRLVGKWTQIPASAHREQDRARAVRAIVGEALGAADELASQRAGLRRQILDAVTSASEAGAQSLFIASEIAKDMPMPVTMTVYAPEELKMSPSIGTEAEHVINTAEAALRAIDTPGLSTATRVAHPHTQALRLHRFLGSTPAVPREFGRPMGEQDAPEGHPLDEGAPEVTSLVVDYWLAVPGTKRTVLVNFFTPMVQIPHLMLALFDGIILASYFQEDES